MANTLAACAWRRRFFCALLRALFGPISPGFNGGAIAPTSPSSLMVGHLLPTYRKGEEGERKKKNSIDSSLGYCLYWKMRCEEEKKFRTGSDATDTTFVYICAIMCDHVPDWIHLAFVYYLPRYVYTYLITWRLYGSTLTKTMVP